MNRLKAWVRAFFGLSRRETGAFIILLPLMFISVFVVPAYQGWKTRQPQDFSKESMMLDSLLTQWKWETVNDSVLQNNATLFAFNPNTASREDFIKLGFSSNLADRIDNYRAKKGRFTIKSDLLKIYGMDSLLYQQVYSFIELPVEKPTKTVATTKTEVIPPRTSERFDINLADTAQLIRIYGIGSKLSQRIIKYRKQLGGFISLNQLQEVYSLDSAVVSELKSRSFIAENFEPAKIFINSATEKQLAAHPYIKYPLAKAITAYRFQHGNFNSVEDLTKIALIDQAFYARIKPYLSLNP